MPAFVIKRPNALRVAAIKKQNTLNIIDAIKNQQASRVNAMKNMLTLRAAKSVCTKENNEIKCDYVPATFESEEPEIVLNKIN